MKKFLVFFILSFLIRAEHIESPAQVSGEIRAPFGIEVVTRDLPKHVIRRYLIESEEVGGNLCGKGSTPFLNVKHTLLPPNTDKSVSATYILRLMENRMSIERNTGIVSNDEVKVSSDGRSAIVDGKAGETVFGFRDLQARQDRTSMILGHIPKGEVPMHSLFSDGGQKLAVQCISMNDQEFKRVLLVDLNTQMTRSYNVPPTTTLHWISDDGNWMLGVTNKKIGLLKQTNNSFLPLTPDKNSIWRVSNPMGSRRLALYYTDEEKPRSYAKIFSLPDLKLLHEIPLAPSEVNGDLSEKGDFILSHTDEGTKLIEVGTGKPFPLTQISAITELKDCGDGKLISKVPIVKNKKEWMQIDVIDFKRLIADENLLKKDPSELWKLIDQSDPRKAWPALEALQALKVPLAIWKERYASFVDAVPSDTTLGKFRQNNLETHLGAPQFSQREKYSRELRNLISRSHVRSYHETIRPLLQNALKQSEISEVTQRIETLIEFGDQMKVTPKALEARLNLFTDKAR